MSLQLDQLFTKKDRISFAKFQALSNAHYYSSNARIGTLADDDFLTNAHVKAFASVIARECERLWHIMGKPKTFQILEIGGGTGIFTKNILEEGCSNGEFFNSIEYILWDIDGVLVKKQKELLKGKNVKWWTGSVFDWQGPTSQIKGVILSNELLDAFPVERVRIVKDEIAVSYITLKKGILQEIWVPLADVCSSLKEKILEYLSSFRKIHGESTMETILRTNEIPVPISIQLWVQRVADILSVGFVLTIDYGFCKEDVRKSFLYPVRVYHERKTEVPLHALKKPGIVDITSNIDFAHLSNLMLKAHFTKEYVVDLKKFLGEIPQKNKIINKGTFSNGFFVSLFSKK